jgi:hypothetical protein
MSDDIIEEIWNKGRSQKEDLSIHQIEQILRPEVRRQSFAIRLYVWIWLLLLLGTCIVDVLNIVGYAENSVMLMVQTGLTLVGIGCGAYGIHLLREIDIMDRADESLIALLKRRRRFYHTKFEIWNLMMAGTILLMTFALNSYVDHEDGTYTIGRVDLFIIFSAVQFAFMYGINKLAQYPIRQEMKIFLSDLEAGVTDGTRTLGFFRRRWRQWAIVVFVIGTILLLFGIWKAMHVGL